MNRRSFLQYGGQAAAGIALASMIPGPRVHAASRTNVLFIAIEDLKVCFGCYGNPVCKTPHIDAFASRGMRFDTTACQYPVCNPTRSSLLTGLRPPTTNVWSNATDWNEHLKPGSTLPEYFRKHGYTAAKVGKIFHAGSGDRSFDERARWTRIIQENEGLPPRPRTAPTTFLFADMSEEERNKTYDTRAWQWGASGQEDLDESDGRIAEQAVRFLQARQNAPFFLGVGFHRPHLPLIAPAPYFNMYPPDRMPLPDYPADDLDDVPAPSYSLDLHKAFTDRRRREAIASYYACVSYVDAGVGRILNALKTSGLEDNTIIMLFGDHGFHMGEHHLWRKTTLYEESARVPFIVSAPGITTPGSVTQRPTELIDMFPTLADLCELPAPQNLEGISLQPLLRNPQRPWKKGAFTYRVKNDKTVRTEQWRYTEWGGNPERCELYDHATDPRELINLAHKPEFTQTQKELQALLHGDWKAALPDGY